MTSIERRFAEAYLRMANFYRPRAPGDGFGGIYLSKEEMADDERLQAEAADYAFAFADEDDRRTFNIGCSNFSTNKAFVWVIEAARCLAGGADETAIKLLNLALGELGAHELADHIEGGFSPGSV